MKRTCLLFTFILTIFLSGRAQNRITVSSRNMDKNSIVKDSVGVVYPYEIWRNMLTSGDYIAREINQRTDSVFFLLFKTSREQQELRASMMPRPADSKFFVTGHKIASFSANDIEGHKINLKNLVGKVVVLNFWFADCPPCRQEIPQLNKLVTKYADDPNVVFIAVALDQGQDVKAFLKTNPFNYQVISGGFVYAHLYNINLYPTNVVLDKEGKVVLHCSGYSIGTPYWISKAIDQALL